MVVYMKKDYFLWQDLNVFMKKALTELQLDRIIEMAWEDRTPFEAIKFQFELTEKAVIELMRR